MGISAWAVDHFLKASILAQISCTRDNNLMCEVHVVILWYLGFADADIPCLYH